MGPFHFWDGLAKHRLKGYPAVGGADHTTTAFNRQGTIFAYAVSYRLESRISEEHTTDRQ